MLGRSPLYDLALHDTLQAHPTLGETSREEVALIVSKFLAGALSHSQAAALFITRFKTSAPIDHLKEILSVSPEPLPAHSPYSDPPFRRKTQQWMPVEDTRLLAAIHKYGTENWNVIARYVGNGRTRSQCSQRWQRGLDPRISRSRWSAEEEALLLELVARHGQKSWIRISSALGNRSDVQCRYRFHQIQKGRAASDDGGAEAEPGTDDTGGAPAENPGQQPTPARFVVEPFTVEHIGLELGANSMSEIFWLLHQ
jgi:hypothetical protein